MNSGQGFGIDSEVIKEFSKMTRMQSKSVPDHPQESIRDNLGDGGEARLILQTKWNP